MQYYGHLCLYEGISHYGKINQRLFTCQTSDRQSQSFTQKNVELFRQYDQKLEMYCQTW